MYPSIERQQQLMVCYVRGICRKNPPLLNKGKRIVNYKEKNYWPVNSPMPTPPVSSANEKVEEFYL